MWVIENAFFRLSASAERGRITSIIDKRSDSECLTNRGLAFWPVEESESPAMVTSRQDEDAAALILSSTDWERRLTWHAWVTVVPNVASVAVKLVVFNRGWSPVDCSPHICAWPTGPMAVVPIRHAAERFDVDDAVGVVGTTYGLREWQLGPQESAVTEARLLWHPSLDRIDFSSADAFARLDKGTLKISSAETRKQQLLLVGSEGRTFETRIDLSPTELIEMPLASLPGDLSIFQLRDEGGRIILSSKPDKTAETILEVQEIPSLDNVLLDEAALKSAARIPSVSAAATFALGLLALREQRWEDAVDFFEDAAILRGDNPLVWWAKNWCLRYLDQQNEHDLANAHFLAPLDPALRADAYLNAPEDSKPDPLLDAWGDDPQPYLEVADLLASAGLAEPRARWLEEARRRAPCSLIELLLAAAHLEHGREMAAAEHVSFAAKAPNRAIAQRPSEILAVRAVSPELE